MAEQGIAIIGECMVEISGQPFAIMRQSFGGDSINTAIYLRQLLSAKCSGEQESGEQVAAQKNSPAQVSYITVMGEDSLSQAIIDKWQDYNLDTQFVLTNPNKNVGLYLIQTDEHGERDFHYWRNDSAAKYLMQHSGIEQVLSAIGHYQACYLSGISIAILPDEDKTLLINALKKLKAQGVKIVFDSNYRPRLWQSVEQTKSCYREMYQLADLLLLTFDDEQAVWGDQSVADCAMRLSEFTPPELVIKDGANGCFYIAGEINQHITTSKVNEIKDTTAAGDSFNAGFLAGWLKQLSPEICGRWGNQLAGQVIQQQGAIVPINLELIE
ncbi:sugar kinase [Colwellia sp. MEBiC06753]